MFLLGKLFKRARRFQLVKSIFNFARLGPIILPKLGSKSRLFVGARPRLTHREQKSALFARMTSDDCERLHLAGRKRYQAARRAANTVKLQRPGQSISRCSP